MIRYLLFIPALVSLLAVWWVYIRIFHIAKRNNLTDNPNARKLQTNPVPVLGGLAVYFGLTAGILTGMMLSVSAYEQTPVIIAASLMLYIGTIDDLMDLSPSLRLCFEVLVILGLVFSSNMCVDSLHGLWNIENFSWWIGVPVTVFAGVGIINAYNMADGVNGLSSGLCVTGAILFGTFSWKSYDFSDAMIAFCFAAALFPFLLHNVFGKKSRMFIGDGGTMVMGTLVTWYVIRAMSRDGLAIKQMESDFNMNLAAMLLAIAAVPVTDTLRVMVQRIIRRKSPFSADKTHFHHVFIGLGVSHSVTALTEIVINLLIVGVWYSAYKLEASLEWQLYVTILSSLLLVVAPYVFLAYQQKHDTPLLQRLRRIAAKTNLEDKAWWLRLQKMMDRRYPED